jgi:hypothetical protein
VAAVANILVVNANMPDAEAYKIVKAVFDNKIDLVRTHQEYMNVNLESQKVKSTPLDFHPGALKYYKEKNIKADLEETEEEIQDFQSEKMSKLNELKVSIVLKIKQI